MSTNLTPDSDTVTEPPDAAKERAWHEWVMVSVGLVGLLSVMGLILSAMALSSTSGARTTVVTVPVPATAARAVIAAAKPMAVSMSVKADSEHGRLGPDKQWHDAIAPADFSVRAGATVTITVANYDSGPHTFTSPALNVNGIIPGGGTMGAPTHTTFTFTAPSKPGRYAWWCAVPCDPWAMAHDGYMRGYVTVTA
jgi:heme/copper-type cytochrome/quinol oxidase subunit 2